MLILSRRDVLDLLTLADCIEAVLQDVAAATAVYEKARATGRGTELKLDE